MLLTQELFKVTHLMGADVWDFLLKCTALTQKCDALSNKDVEVGECVTFPGLSALHICYCLAFSYYYEAPAAFILESRLLSSSC